MLFDSMGLAWNYQFDSCLSNEYLDYKRFSLVKVRSKQIGDGLVAVGR